MSEPESDTEGETITIHELLERSAESALELQREDGSFPPGRNYTYDEPETPVRMTSYWVLTLSKLYERTGEREFESAANAAVDYLLCDDIRPYGFTFHARTVKEKDKCNGLVGQASPIRALATAGETLDRDDAVETAREVFDLHPFNEDIRLWERVEINGDYLSFDRTLNHQLIFAAAAGRLAKKFPSVETRLQRFLNTLTENMELHSNGLIKHYIHPPLFRTLSAVVNEPRYYNLLVNEIAHYYYSLSTERRKKERGYQTVNLYALSRLKRVYPEHEVWDSDAITRAIEFLRSYKTELIEKKNVKHGSPLQGISIAKILLEFEGKSINEYRQLIQSDLTEDPIQSETIFNTNGLDSNTQSALIVALTDLPNVQLNPE